jgi:N-hydroxyarylamine O-acetyltransferase
LDSEIDLDAYFARIGHEGRAAADMATLRAVHLAHPSSIPFESLDPFLGRPVRLDPASLQAKLVTSGRGGYCFEQNGLFLLALQALGFAVTPLAARVRWMLAEDAPRTPLSHMLLKVDLPEGVYLADVGFGGQSPTAPLRLEPGLEQATLHGTYRVMPAKSGALELQMQLPGPAPVSTSEARWQAMHRFTTEPQGPEDYETYNWRTATHPQSRFTNNLVASRVVGDTRINLLNRERTVHRPDGRTERAVLADAAALGASLARDFGLRLDAADLDSLQARLPAPAPSH